MISCETAIAAISKYHWKLCMFTQAWIPPGFKVRVTLVTGWRVYETDYQPDELAPFASYIKEEACALQLIEQALNYKWIQYEPSKDRSYVGASNSVATRCNHLQH